MSRPTRTTRQISTDFNDIFDFLNPEDEDLLMQQALLEAVNRVQTPTSSSIGRMSRRPSRAPAYDPAHPNAQEVAVPYDPAVWGAMSEGSSGSRRPSTPVLRQANVRYSPTAPANSPSLRSQRQTQRYSPTSPLHGQSSRLYDPNGYGRRSLSAAAGGEPSPGYSHYGSFGVGPASPTTASIAARLDRLTEMVESIQRQDEIRTGRLDRLEAQLEAFSDIITDLMNGTTPTIAAPENPISRGSKRKRSSNKKVSFDTSDEEGGDDSDAPSSPAKKPKNFSSPKTPSRQVTASSDPPKAPRKAAPKRPTRAASKTPLEQTDSAVTTPSKAPRRNTRKAAEKSPSGRPSMKAPVETADAPKPVSRANGRPRRAAASKPVDYSDVKRKTA